MCIIKNNQDLLGHGYKFLAKRFEDEIPFFYSDTEAVPTIGCGHAMGDKSMALSVPLYHKDTEKPATTKEVESLWTKIKNYGLAFYNSDQAMPTAHKFGLLPWNNLRIKKKDIEEILHVDITNKIKDLKKRMPDLYSYPLPAQLGLLDMTFNMGIEKLMGNKKYNYHGFPNMLRAVSKRDWETVAKESHRTKIQEFRNIRTAGLFRIAAKQERNEFDPNRIFDTHNELVNE